MYILSCSPPPPHLPPAVWRWSGSSSEGMWVTECNSSCASLTFCACVRACVRACVCVCVSLSLCCKRSYHRIRNTDLPFIRLLTVNMTVICVICIHNPSLFIYITAARTLSAMIITAIWPLTNCRKKPSSTERVPAREMQRLFFFIMKNGNVITQQLENKHAIRNCYTNKLDN